MFIGLWSGFYVYWFMFICIAIILLQVILFSLLTFQIFLGIASFFTISLGAMLIGTVTGVLTAIFTKYTDKVRGRLKIS